MNKKFTIVLLLAFSALFLNAQNREFTTYTYFEHDTLALELDLFLPDNPENEKLPLLIYVHGGGFSQGNRASGHNLCSFLADSGFAAASITYTLYMKGKSFSCDGILSEKVKAIQFAASQLYQATAFLIDMADNFNIDTSSVFIAGSSAGAETVLQAAFWDYGTMNLYANNLPAGFSYAGVVSGAGAIMDLNFITPENSLPVMMFHGNNDKLVPYATAAHHYCPPSAPGWLMLFGSKSIYEHLSAMGGPVQLYTFDGQGHDYAGAYFYQNQQPVLDFMNAVLEGQKFQNHTVISVEK